MNNNTGAGSNKRGPANNKLSNNTGPGNNKRSVILVSTNKIEN